MCFICFPLPEEFFLPPLFLSLVSCFLYKLCFSSQKSYMLKVYTKASHWSFCLIMRIFWSCDVCDKSAKNKPSVWQKTPFWQNTTFRQIYPLWQNVHFRQKRPRKGPFWQKTLPGRKPFLAKTTFLAESPFLTDAPFRQKAPF